MMLWLLLGLLDFVFRTEPPRVVNSFLIFELNIDYFRGFKIIEAKEISVCIVNRFLSVHYHSVKGQLVWSSEDYIVWGFANRFLTEEMGLIKMSFQGFIVLVKKMFVFFSADVASEVVFVHMAEQLHFVEHVVITEITVGVRKNFYFCFSTWVSIVIMVI